MGTERSLLDVLVPASALTLAAAVPFLYAALGELFGQRSGMLNLGVEGIMLLGAFTAIYVASEKGLNAGLLPGILASMLVGAVLGLIMAVINVTMQAVQGISGIGMTLVGGGMATLLFRVLVDGAIVVDTLPSLRIPLLSELPLLGEVFFSQNAMIYIAFLLVPLSVWILNRTTWGLQVRAVGQNPNAADTMGVNVVLVRYSTVVLGGMLASMAGASMSLALTGVFQVNMTAGRGFIAVALVYFGGWSPWKVMLGALLFSAANNLQIWAQVLDLRLGGEPVPANLLIMLPYLLTIVALVFARDRQRRAPSALTRPFTRGEN